MTENELKVFIKDYRKGLPLHLICRKQGIDRIEALRLVEKIKEANKKGRVSKGFKELVTDRYLGGASVQSIANEIGSNWKSVNNWITSIVAQRYGTMG